MPTLPEKNMQRDAFWNKVFCGIVALACGAVALALYLGDKIWPAG